MFRWNNIEGKDVVLLALKPDLQLLPEKLFPTDGCDVRVTYAGRVHTVLSYWSCPAIAKRRNCDPEIVVARPCRWLKSTRNMWQACDFAPQTLLRGL